MQGMDYSSASPTQHAASATTLRQSSTQLRELLSGLASQNGKRRCSVGNEDAVPSLNPMKRARLDLPPSAKSSDTASATLNNVDTDAKLTMDSPLPDDLTESLINIYFSRIHPWIPMLHVVRFRTDFKDPMLRPKLSTILLAITSICARFSDDARLGNLEEKAALAKAYRRRVILHSMESFSVENLQAMILIAFDTVCCSCTPTTGVISVC